MASDVDALIVHPMNANDGAEAMQKAYDAGIHVLVFDTEPNCDYSNCFMASNEELGIRLENRLQTGQRESGQQRNDTGYWTGKMNLPQNS